jgi:hypothetical protein
MFHEVRTDTLVAGSPAEGWSESADFLSLWPAHHHRFGTSRSRPGWFERSRNEGSPLIGYDAFSAVIPGRRLSDPMDPGRRPPGLRDDDCLPFCFNSPGCHRFPTFPLDANNLTIEDVPTPPEALQYAAKRSGCRGGNRFCTAGPHRDFKNAAARNHLWRSPFLAGRKKRNVTFDLLARPRDN